MNANPRTPRIVVTLELEGRVDVVLDVEPAEVTRLADYVGADPRRRQLLMCAVELAQSRPSDIAVDDATFAALAAALAPPSAPAHPYDAIAPKGSYQSWSIARILAADGGRDWLRWALLQPWPLDAEFAAALAIVAEREGLEP